MQRARPIGRFLPVYLFPLAIAAALVGARIARAQDAAAPSPPDAAAATEAKASEPPSPDAAQTAPAQNAPRQTEPAAPQPAASSPPASEPAFVDNPVSFYEQVQPILAAHCIKCHGANMRRGGLRLDTKLFAQAGGDSGQPVLAGTLETNELYRRVSSHDATYRMPKNAPALADHEIELIKRWVEQGTPWPEHPPDPDSVGPFWKRWSNYAANLVQRYEREFTYVRPYAIGFIVLQVLMLVVMRCGRAYREQRPWATHRWAWFCRRAAGVKTSEMLLVLLLSAAGVSIALGRGRLIRLEDELSHAQADRSRQMSQWTHTVYGWPPQPIRPDHPPRIAGTYYRGNCERNKELFNGGNYLTCLFHVSLCDQEHRPLSLGQEPPPGGLFVKIEIERAPGTSEMLFSKGLMESVSLSKTYYEESRAPLKEAIQRLEIVEPDHRWVAYVPIGQPDTTGRLTGLIYMYTGQIREKLTDAVSLHYGVKYDLVYTDGKLAPESDLWMNSFGNGAFTDPVPAGKLPYSEWFDYREMPVITGENTKDPKLLGVEEYERKGLIKPETPKQEQKQEEPLKEDGSAPAPDPAPTPQP